MKIGIIGAGNLGTAIAADLGRENNIRIYSSKPSLFSDTVTWIDDDTEERWSTDIDLASDSYEDVVADSDVVFVAVPTFMIRHVVESILPYIKRDTMIGFVPGAGGVEYLTRDIVSNGNTIFGFERVPYVARVQQYGVSVRASKKSKYRLAALPSSKTNEVCSIITNLFNRPCKPMSEFISMTLTPSLHASRLYDLYKDHITGQEYDQSPFFYREWRDSASYITFEIDEELHRVCESLTFNGITAKIVKTSTPFSL